jgi:hypothetical protein
MRIHSITWLFALPFLALLVYFIFRIVNDNYENSIFVFVPLVILAILYNSKPNLDFWWLQKFPPKLDKKMKDWLVSNLPYYSKFNEADQKKFDERLMLYIEAREFKSVASKELKDVPYDIRCILSSQAIRLCLWQEDYLIKDLDRVYMYRHPFPTPQHQFIHTVESEVKDGVIIFALDYALAGIVKPKQHYNIVLHGYAEAYAKLFTQVNFPEPLETDWKIIDAHFHNLNFELIKNTLGFPYVDLLPVHIVLFFEYNDVYAEYFPEYFEVFKRIFMLPYSIA